MMSLLGFALLATLIAIPALMVVRSKDLIRAVLWLTLMLVSTAVLYAALDAPFLAGVQVLTYVGGVVTLMIFGVMVTRRSEGNGVEIDGADKLRGFVAAAGLFGLMASCILRSELPGAPTAMATTNELALQLTDTYLMAFEVASLLLLGAIVGAVVLARKRDPEPAVKAEPAPAIVEGA